MRARALVLFLLAGSGRTSRAQLTDLEFHATSSIKGVAPALLATSVTVTNRNTAPVGLQFGACALKLRGYRSSDKSGKPVWYSEFAHPSFIRQSQMMCVLMLYERTLAPGQSTSFGARIPTYEILADSLPAGRYYIAAELELNSEKFVFDAGSAEISSEQKPLPVSRTLNGIQFSSSVQRVSFEPANRDSLDLTFTARNTTSEMHRVDFNPGGSWGCIYMDGYADRAERDTYYLKPAYAADWIARPCPIKAPPYIELLPGESQTLTNRIAAPEKPLHYVFAFDFWLDQNVADATTIEGDLAADEITSH